MCLCRLCYIPSFQVSRQEEAGLLHGLKEVLIEYHPNFCVWVCVKDIMCASSVITHSLASHHEGLDSFPGIRNWKFVGFMVQNGGDTSNIDTFVAKASVVGMDWAWILSWDLQDCVWRLYWFVLIHCHLRNVWFYYFVVLCESYFLSAQFCALYIGKMLLHKILNLFLDCLC